MLLPLPDELNRTDHFRRHFFGVAVLYLGDCRVGLGDGSLLPVCVTCILPLSRRPHQYQMKYLHHPHNMLPLPSDGLVLLPLPSDRVFRRFWIFFDSMKIP